LFYFSAKNQIEPIKIVSNSSDLPDLLEFALRTSQVATVRLNRPLEGSDKTEKRLKILDWATQTAQKWIKSCSNSAVDAPLPIASRV
jgi:hypothetical protein